MEPKLHTASGETQFFKSMNFAWSFRKLLRIKQNFYVKTSINNLEWNEFFFCMNFKLKKVNEVFLQWVTSSHSFRQTCASGGTLRNPSLVAWRIFIALKIQEPKENIWSKLQLRGSGEHSTAVVFTWNSRTPWVNHTHITSSSASSQCSDTVWQKSDGHSPVDSANVCMAN